MEVSETEVCLASEKKCDLPPKIIVQVSRPQRSGREHLRYSCKRISSHVAMSLARESRSRDTSLSSHNSSLEAVPAAALLCRKRPHDRAMPMDHEWANTAVLLQATTG